LYGHEIQNGEAKNMKQALVSILSDGQFHSGEEIGAALGVSRAAVWKQLKKLEIMNIPFNSVKGKGYRLPEAVTLLDSDALCEYGFPQDVFDSIDISLSLDSTNDAMMKLAENNIDGRKICFAEMQTAGRGRRGRTWVSPFAQNLYFSILWPFSQGIAAIQGLSLVVGLAVYRGLSELGVESAGLKWPNDILADHKGVKSKLGGILIELTGDVTDACQVVIGVGLNLDVRIQDQAHIDQAAVGIKQLGVTADRNQIAATIVKHLVEVLREFSDSGFESFKDEWSRADAYRGKAAKLILPSSEVNGICSGVNEKGELALETENGVQWFNAGEVSLRLEDSK
jgi:BirA family biotin operon repressor/biotin-[acetyl-CoA-carboxylase] ligase